MPLSTIAILAIIIAVLVTLYFIVGSAVRYHSGFHHFPEVLPNYLLWGGLAECLVRVLTCGWCKPSWTNGAGRSHRSRSTRSAEIMMLPNRLQGSRDVIFEALSDEEWEAGTAMQPAEVVVRF